MLTFEGLGFPAKPSTRSWNGHRFELIRSGDDELLLALEDFLRTDPQHENAPAMEDLFEDAENAPFTESEQEHIGRLLEDLKVSVSEMCELSGDQQRLLDAKLRYVGEASLRMGRVDWLNVTYGALGGAFAGGILTPPVVRAAVNGLLAGVGHLFGIPMPQLPSGA